MHYAVGVDDDVPACGLCAVGTHRAVLRQHGSVQQHRAAAAALHCHQSVACDRHQARCGLHLNLAATRHRLLRVGCSERSGTHQGTTIECDVAAQSTERHAATGCLTIRKRAATRPQRQVALRLEHQFAAVTGQRLGLYRARVRQRAGKDTDRPSTEIAQVEHLVAVVLHRKGDVVQIAPGDFDHFTRRQYDIAALAGNCGCAIDSDIRRHQVDIAIAGADAPLGLDVARCPLARKPVSASLEVVVIHGQGGRHKTLGIDDAASAKHDAIGVDQEHPAVRTQGAIDAALQVGILRLHPVQHRAGGALLLKVGGLTGLDRETLPVDDGARAVGHRELVALGLQACLAVGHLRSGGIGLHQLRRYTVDSGQRGDQGAAAKGGRELHGLLLTAAAGRRVRLAHRDPAF